MNFGNEYNNLLLEQLVDTSDNELTVLIYQTKSIKPSEGELNSESNEKIRNIISTSMKIAPNESQIYEIYFESYLMYQTRNESYSCSDFNYDIRKGKGLIIFEKSRLLDYVGSVIDLNVAKHMWGRDELKHYGIYTLNNIIDIITLHDPIIKKANFTQ